MPPNTITHLNSVDDQTGNISKSKSGQGKDGQPASTYSGIWKYPTNRDDTLRSAENWMECKKIDDDIGSQWRVFDKLYDFTPFIPSHPGGSQWLEMSRGTDITEVFVASHVVNTKCVEKMLENYFVKEATSPRISPYTLKPDGFYMTLRQRVEPIFKKIGTGPTITVRVMQDALTAAFLVFTLLATVKYSMTLAFLAGTFLAFQTIASHNFIHIRDNWRRYLMDLSLISSFEYRITHVFSHHMYPNTLMDIELHVFPTHQFLPNRHKSWIQRHFALYYCPLVYASSFWFDICKRVAYVCKGEKSIRPENLLVFVELLVLMAIAPEPMQGLYIWLALHTTCSLVLQTIGETASHHHTTCFHDGDEPLADPDFGIGQLDATRDRAENIFNTLFVTLVTFGHHPLHHLFPTVCHSKLHHVKQVFEETVQEFKLDYPGVPQKELFFTCFETLARTEPHTRKNVKKD